MTWNRRTGMKSASRGSPDRAPFPCDRRRWRRTSSHARTISGAACSEAQSPVDPDTGKMDPDAPRRSSHRSPRSADTETGVVTVLSSSLRSATRLAARSTLAGQGRSWAAPSWAWRTLLRNDRRTTRPPDHAPTGFSDHLPPGPAELPVIEKAWYRSIPAPTDPTASRASAR